MNGSNKVKPHHLEREACLYIRQSSIAQVMNGCVSPMAGSPWVPIS